MRRVMIAAALLGALATQASAEAYKLTADGNTMIVSCFRGPWKDVIWDRPNSNFIDSLIDFGYDYPNAHAIAERICRDDRLVNNKEAMKAEMIRIYYESPEIRAKTRILR
ncbi:hypothetical protein [Pseudodonghicola flavimaris]|uniref:Uncharacterized protein n=1 Tax=Pseudodonghicola flavimaris TaxID=3050036 RepID=A0ABT7F358_9RHOB|nr:hypothetical protein [Pseudodonghicola flavimaris]MDK3019028.1 hypothetical protein [Pseudodonghicola flavimaris]